MRRKHKHRHGKEKGPHQAHSHRRPHTEHATPTPISPATQSFVTATVASIGDAIDSVGNTLAQAIPAVLGTLSDAYDKAFAEPFNVKAEGIKTYNDGKYDPIQRFTYLELLSLKPEEASKDPKVQKELRDLRNAATMLDPNGHSAVFVENAGKTLIKYCDNDGVDQVMVAPASAGIPSDANDPRKQANKDRGPTVLTQPGIRYTMSMTTSNYHGTGFPFYMIRRVGAAQDDTRLARGKGPESRRDAMGFHRGPGSIGCTTVPLKDKNGKPVAQPVFEALKKYKDWPFSVITSQQAAAYANSMDLGKFANAVKENRTLAAVNPFGLAASAPVPAQLYEGSGHAGFYRNALFPFTTEHGAPDRTSAAAVPVTLNTARATREGIKPVASLPPPAKPFQLASNAP